MNKQALEEEINYRFDVYKKLRAASDDRDGMRLPAKLINDEKVFFGGRGIWRDATRTCKISEDDYGLTFGVLHTGASYDDDMDDFGGLYHYPVTKQSSTDVNEVESMKNCMRFGVPIFAITKPSINSKLRNVHLAWVTSFDDEGMISIDDRLNLINQSISSLPEKDLSKIKVEKFNNLLVHYVKSKNASLIIRGLRAVSDFEYEFLMTGMNRSIDKDI